MQVKVRVNESKISLVQPGMQSTIHVEAVPNKPIGGEVREVGEYPARTSWYGGQAKNYEVIVGIDGQEQYTETDLRVGFTAEVRIRVAEQPDALKLPIQSILTRGGKNYVLIPAGKGRWRAEEVQIGPSNDRWVVIQEGLEEGDQVVHNAEENRDKLALPQI
jgi:HlyD family secretion protein